MKVLTSRLPVAWSWPISGSIFAAGNDSRNFRWMKLRSACSTMRGLLASAIRTSARNAVRFSLSSSAMILRRNGTVPTSPIFPIASRTGLRSEVSL